MTPLMRMSTRSEIATSVNCVRRTRQCSQVESWVVAEELTRLLSQHVVDCVIPVPADTKMPSVERTEGEEVNEPGPWNSPECHGPLLQSCQRGKHDRKY